MTFNFFIATYNKKNSYTVTQYTSLSVYMCMYETKVYTTETKVSSNVYPYYQR